MNIKIGAKELRSLGMLGIRAMNKNLPSILSGFAICGLVATVVTTYKAAPDVESAIEGKKLDKADKNEDESAEDVKLSPIEVVAAAAPYVWKPAVCGLFTAGCIVGAQVLNVQRLTMLAGAYKLSEGKLKEYEEKAKELLGEKKVEEVHQAVAEDIYNKGKMNGCANGKIIETGMGHDVFYDPYSGRMFYSSMEAIRAAESELNKRLFCGDTVLLNDFYTALNLDGTKFGDHYGWSSYSGASGKIYPASITVNNIVDYDDADKLTPVVVGVIGCRLVLTDEGTCPF